ncbi:hypothetical protein GEMRC1_011965 [Eukaryota sp. GEM-RC1]
MSSGHAPRLGERKSHHSEQVFPLSTKSEGRKVFLISLPSSIIDNWSTVEDSKTQVGTFRITQRPNEPPEYTIVSHMDVPSVPSSFTLKRDPNTAPLKYLTINEQSSSASIDGTIHDRFRGQPVKNSAVLQRISAHRKAQEMTRPKTKSFDSQEQIKVMGGYDVPVDLRKPTYDRKDEKRVRMEKDALKNLLFTLYTRCERWTLQQLVDETDQPVTWLREVLDEVCIRNVSGPNKDLYELKPEYRFG